MGLSMWMGTRRDLAAVHHLAEQERHDLGARDGEGWDEDRAAAGRVRRGTAPATCFVERFLVVDAVAVGGFEHEGVAAGERLRVGMQRRVAAAKVAAEDDS